MQVTDINIPEPCAEDWDQMTPGERGRFCASCQKTVHDLSAMTRDEARELLARDGDMCVSYLSRGDAVMFAAPKVVPLARLTRRRLPQVAAAGLTLALAACTPHGEGPSLDTQQHETPAFLEFSPPIPVEAKTPDAEPVEVEPCDTPEAKEIDAPRRTAGARLPIRERKPEVAPVLGRVQRTKGDRIRPSLDPLEGL